MKILFKIIDWLSGEWLLNGRPNSGAIIFLRSLKVATLLFLSSILVISVIDPDRTMEPSLREFQKAVIENFAWFGAIFAAVYAAFYTRYASQWAYVAGLYNQILAVKSTLSDEQKSQTSFLNWQAGLIEDAVLLHLDRKPVFSLPIKDLLEDPAILRAFIMGSSTELVDKVLARHIPERVEEVRKFQAETQVATLAT